MPDQTITAELETPNRATRRAMREPKAKNVRLPDQQLVPDLMRFIQRYVVLPTEDHARILALWIIHTWAFEHARATPYLYIYSPEKQSGKTLLLEVLEMVVRNPLRSTNMTSSVIFRAVATLDPTLMLDEVDAVWSGSRNEAMRGILNGGYKRGGFVLRIQVRQPTKFPTFCPKILAGINNGFLPDTIADRCIPIRMARKPKGAVCERFNSLDVADGTEVKGLLDRIEAFCDAFSLDIAVQRPDALTALTDRQGEITEPLLALATVLGCKDALVESLMSIFAETKDKPSVAQLLLGAIRDAFGDASKIFTDDLLAQLGPAWNGKLLGVHLAPYGITPGSIRIGNQNLKGYKREDFEPIWETYL